MHIDAGSARFVIFSDQHKGKRDGADDFQRAEKAYNAALEYYFAAGYTLLALGDVEELWECRAREVIAAYRRTLELEAAFHHEGRYVRFFGNHDDQWESAGSVTKHLGPLFPNLEVREGLRLVLADAGASAGEIFLVHGHQGSSSSHRLRWISKPVVRYIWRPIQRLTGWRLNSPATSFKLRGETNRAMYEWAKHRGDVLLIAGHTHKPVFPLVTPNGPPCYFNSGCCCFDDGECTGIEIADGQIRLVRWPDDEGRPQKKVIRSVPLADVLP
jgi:UDP-2,3-diacylglucosamine pyrophosphatase LpxH